ncbi:hypothetical protein [Kocuria sp. KH4]
METIALDQILSLSKRLDIPRGASLERYAQARAVVKQLNDAAGKLREEAENITDDLLDAAFDGDLTAAQKVLTAPSRVTKAYAADTWTKQSQSIIDTIGRRLTRDQDTLEEFLSNCQAWYAERVSDPLTAHRETLPEDLTDAQSILQAGPEAAAAWGQVNAAIGLAARFDQISAFLTVLRYYASVSGPHATNARVMRFENPEQAEQVAAAKADNQLWTAVRLGVDVGPLTATEAAASAKAATRQPLTEKQLQENMHKIGMHNLTFR